MMMPSGFTYGVKKLQDGTLMWFLKRHGKDVRSGSAGDPKEADAQVKKAIGEQAVEIGKKLQDRSRLQMSMKRFLTRRIYLVSHVFQGALERIPPAEVCMTAAEGERDWHDREEKRTGFAWPLSTHHSVKPAREAAEQIIALMRALGLSNEMKVLAYARKYIGKAFEQGSTGVDVAAMDAAAEQAKREDDARDAKRAGKKS